METTTVGKATGVLFAACLALGAVATEPEISDVVVRQRWPWSRLVDIEYTLDCDPTQTADITVIAREGSQILDLPTSSLSGDLYGVARGFRRIVWDPTKSAYTNVPLMRFRAELRAARTPAYMIVDLKETPDGERVTYVTDETLANGAYGACVTNTVNGIQTIVWTDVTNAVGYASDKLVLRRIPAGSFEWGEGANATNATLSQPYYIGVFEVTQKQWSLIYSSLTWPSTFSMVSCRDTRPVETLSYQMIRGLSATTNDYPDVSPVAEDSFVGRLRARTGLDGFDLPTEAQWTCAFQAGEGRVTYAGAALIGMGRNGNNGGTLPQGSSKASLGTTNGTARAGSYTPNNWGLYDMYGNVYEMVLDWSASSVGQRTFYMGGVDPKGLKESALRHHLRKGAAYPSTVISFASDGRWFDRLEGVRNEAEGVRIVLRLP
jgi:hypothetical protein